MRTTGKTMPMKQVVIGLMLMALWGMASVGIAQVDTWTRKADMPVAASGLSTSVVDGKIYVIGGWAAGFNTIFSFK